MAGADIDFNGSRDTSMDGKLKIAGVSAHACTLASRSE
jgi:hypothetical protein